MNTNLVRLYSCIAILAVLLVSPFLSTYFPTRTLFFLLNIFSVCLFILLRSRWIGKAGWLYLGVMFIAFLMHLGDKVVLETPLYYLFVWSNVVILYYALNKETEGKKNLSLFMLTLFLVECLVCIYERITHAYVFDYSFEFQATAGYASDYTETEFRAHGLLNHPLYNANVISIFMALILCNRQIRNTYKVVLLAIGTLALLACNSRGSMIIWLLIFLYRFFFYNRNIVVVLLCGLILYLLFPVIIGFIEHSNLFGRLSSSYENEFSTLSRVIAFEVFADQDWTWEKILTGGDIVYYDNTDIGLENGVLLNLAFWGWIIGTIKTVIEFYLTYETLYLYSVREKFIIYMALWGVALTNSNSFQSFIFIYFFVANAAFSFNDSLSSIKMITRKV